MAVRGINKVILVGRLGKDPEVRYIPNGGAVANLQVATSESWRDKQTGEMREQTEWHRVVLFGKLAEVAGECLRKGAQVYIEGQLRTRSWEDNGITRYVTEILVKTTGTMQMLVRAAGAQTQPEEAIRRETERRADEIVRKMAENKPDLPDGKTEQAVRDIAGLERDRSAISEREAALPESVLREPQRVREAVREVARENLLQERLQQMERDMVRDLQKEKTLGGD